MFLINGLPSKPLGNKSPYELLLKTKPNYSQLKFVGCLYYSYLKSYAYDKLEMRSLPYIFLGYENYNKRYKFLDPSIFKTYISPYAIFNQQQFPFLSHTVPSRNPSLSIVTQSPT